MQDNQLLVKTVMLQMVEEDQYAEDQSGLLVFNGTFSTTRLYHAMQTLKVFLMTSTP